MSIASITGGSGRSWAVFLSRAAAMKVLVAVALVGTFGVVMSSAGSAPFEQAELVGASRNPVGYRAFVAFDILEWLGFGAVLLGFAALSAGVAPVRSTCLAALAVGQVVGMIGGYLRLTAGAELASRYADAGPSERDSLLQFYPTLAATIGAHFGLGQVLYGIAFLLIASIAISTSALPRYLAYLIGLIGAYALANQLSVVIVGTFLWAPLFFVFLALTIVMDVGVALTFWHRAALVPASP